MSSNPFASRMTLPQLRAIVAIHSGRVDVRPATSQRDSATFVLRGRGMVLALLASGGTVDRFMVSDWVQQIRLWDARGLGAERKEPDAP